MQRLVNLCETILRKFPSPRGAELHKPKTDRQLKEYMDVLFPSPRGAELHKPGRTSEDALPNYRSFRPLAGLSCINPDGIDRPVAWWLIEFPSPRGAELHKPNMTEAAYGTTAWCMFPSPRGAELHKPPHHS